MKNVIFSIFLLFIFKGNMVFSQTSTVSLNEIITLCDKNVLDVIDFLSNKNHTIRQFNSKEFEGHFLYSFTESSQQIPKMDDDCGVIGGCKNFMNFISNYEKSGKVYLNFEFLRNTFPNSIDLRGLRKDAFLTLKNEIKKNKKFVRDTNSHFRISDSGEILIEYFIDNNTKQLVGFFVNEGTPNTYFIRFAIRR
jgi:hypothetical protein